MRVKTVPGTGECFDLDRPGAVTAWNRALNRRYGMENVREHPSGLHPRRPAAYNDRGAARGV